VKNFNRTRLAAAVSGGLLLVAVAMPGAALAHERRTIAGGKYDVVVGWSNEPAYVGMKNSATIRIMNAGTTTPVTGAEKSLKLAIRQGASTQAFPLEAVFGQEGLYSADIMPTRVGDYQWIFSGDVGGNSVNETFDTADGKFNGVQPANTLQFPVQIGDPVQNAAAVQAAQADAQSARMLAMVAIVIGVLGVIAGVAAYAIGTRRAQARAASTRAATARPASERV
jgi:hypothetical protein